MTHDLDPALVEEAYALQAHMGFRMTGWRDGWARFALPQAPFLMNRYGIPHGGVYAMLLDTVMGYACSWTGEPGDRRFVMTLSMTTSFLSRPGCDGELVAEGRKVGGGAKTFFAEAAMRDASGALLATASGTFRARGGSDTKP